MVGLERCVSEDERGYPTRSMQSHPPCERKYTGVLPVLVMLTLEAGAAAGSDGVDGWCSLHNGLRQGIEQDIVLPIPSVRKSTAATATNSAKMKSSREAGTAGA